MTSTVTRWTDDGPRGESAPTAALVALCRAEEIRDYYCLPPSARLASKGDVCIISQPAARDSYTRAWRTPTWMFGLAEALSTAGIQTAYRFHKEI